MFWLVALAACTSSNPEPTDSEATDVPATATASDTEAQQTETETPDAEVHELSVEELHTWLESGEELLLINVHIPYAGEIPGTDQHIPYTAIDELQTAIGALSTTVVLYCKTGPMSAQAATELVELGYYDLYDVPAGMNGWEAAGYSLD